MSNTIEVSFGKGKEHIYNYKDKITDVEYINLDYPRHDVNDVAFLPVQQLLKYRPNLRE